LIQSNATAGIVFCESTNLSLVNSTIARNDGYGVQLGNTERERCAGRFKIAREGEIEGYGNTIPGPGDPDGNSLGGICPPGFQFLAEAGAETGP